jgi:membrane protein YqaA with SNARE-associated domain
MSPPTDPSTPAEPLRVPTASFRQRVSMRRRLRGIYLVVHRWAESGWATSAIGAWAFLQASLVPGPVEAFFLPLALADRKRVWRFATAAVVGSSLGALLAFAIGYFAFDTIGVHVIAMLGFDGTDVARSRALFAAHGWLLVFLSTVTPVSLKLSSIAAGAFGVPVAQFALVVFAGRSLRFLATAAVVYYAGERLARYLARPETLAP